MIPEPSRMVQKEPHRLPREERETGEILNGSQITEKPFSSTTAPPVGHSHQPHSFFLKKEPANLLLTHRGPMTLQPDILILGWVNLDLVAIKGRAQKALLVKWKYCIQEHNWPSPNII